MLLLVTCAVISDLVLIVYMHDCVACVPCFFPMMPWGNEMNTVNVTCASIIEAYKVMYM